MPAPYGPPETAPELKRREAVWAALSDLYLDTEVTDRSIAAIVRAARDQGCGAEDLRAMLLYEVAPAVYANIYSIAGEWALFDPVWLSERIQHRWKRPLHRWRCRLARRHMLGPIEADLQRLWRALAASP